MAKKRCPKGMAKSIVRNAMKKHPKWTAKQISENYPVGESTCHREMKKVRDEKELLGESLQKAINAHAEPTREELKSNRWLVFAGVMAGVALMLMFVIFERGVQ
jgi:hypothetical protein